jgi:hypothetical protein
MDGKAAITADYKSGTGYAFPPVNTMRTSRADRAYIAARLRFSANVTVSSCDTVSGGASVTSLDTHVVGCHVFNGSDCVNAERSFTDMMRPMYAPGASTLQLQRVSASAVCADMRAALP